MGKKILIKPAQSAHTSPATWRIEGVLMTSTRDLRKDFLTSLEINEKNYPFSSHLLEKMWEYEKLSQRSKRVKNLPQLVSLISTMLPRSRNCH